MILAPQTRRRDGQLIGATYDALGRVTLMDAPGTANDVTYAYDNFSRQVAAGALNYAYDQLSRLTSAVAAQGSVSYLYDAAGRRTRMTWPDGFYVTTDYDLTNAMTAIRENGAASGAGVLASFAYDNLGRRVSLTRGNGAVTAYAYDAASRLQTLTQDLPGTSYDQTYGLSYNAASQVTQRSGSNAAYDLPAPAGGGNGYVRNGLNQYTSVSATPGGTVTPTYDARGNLTGYGGATYAYDIFNRLISATPAGGAAASLSYDSAGRLAQIASASTTRFLYDGADMIAEYNGSNALQRRTVHGPGIDEPLVWYEGAGTAERRYLIADQLGSIVAANGAATEIYAYDEYGQPNAWTGARFRYTGQMMLPEAQLYHYKARAYLPSLGRFAQTDPIHDAGGTNFYAYVGNDPINHTDATGLCETETGSRICGGGSGGSPLYIYYISGTAPLSAYEAAQQKAFTDAAAWSILLQSFGIATQTTDPQFDDYGNEVIVVTAARLENASISVNNNQLLADAGVLFVFMTEERFEHIARFHNPYRTEVIAHSDQPGRIWTVARLGCARRHAPPSPARDRRGGERSAAS